jgi:hypothetical protein
LRQASAKGANISPEGFSFHRRSSFSISPLIAMDGSACK